MMIKKKRVIVAMSGGVDSSVAAYLLSQNYEVIGITMQIWEIHSENIFTRNCCSLEAVNDAQKVARILNIPHYTINFREIFQKKVVEKFSFEYLNAKTPNPCIDCNKYIKFNALIKKAKDLDAHFIATGHYAKIIYDFKDKTYKLFKGKDLKKDQSYFLYCLKKEDLPKILFPLGNFTKEEIRALALKINLPVAKKLDSQEICFIEKDYKKFLKEKFKDKIKKGKILNLEGKFLGIHKGLPFYTIGQRRGLEISAPAPLYVIKMDLKNNTLIVGEDKALFKRELTASEINWISNNFTLKVKAKIRYNMKEKEAQIFKENENKIKVVFSSSKRAITPGQAVVFYQGDEVLGGGVITCSDS